MLEKKSITQLNLLKELLKGESVCLSVYATSNDLSIRTLQRYMKEIKEVFGDNIKKDRDSYQFISKNILEFDIEELESLIDILYIIDSSLLKKLNLNPLKTIEDFDKKQSEYFFIKSSSFETNISQNIINKIKEAIKKRRYINIKYKSDKEYELRQIKPIKIVISKGNFYLAVVSSDLSINNGFKFLRVKFIHDIEILSKTYNRDIDADMFIKKFQTLFSNYREKDYEVIIEVDKSVKRFFKNKNFLSSQKIISDNDDENMLISFSITNDMEIFPLVKKWIPHLKIVSPQSSKKNLENDLRIFLRHF